MQTVERKLADTILEKEFIIKVGNREYNFRIPTLATMFEISALISEGSGIKIDLEEDVLNQVLLKSKDCKNLPKIMATMIMGVRHPDERDKKYKKEFNDLTDYILYNITPTEWFDIFEKCLAKTEVGPFARVMHFLSENRITKSTKTIDRTAHSQQ